VSWPWSELGLSGPAALPEIRSAYAQRLKATHPEEDPEGFQRLHTAYQEASRQARRRAPEEPGPSPKAPQSSAQEGPQKLPGKPEPKDPEWDYEELLKNQEDPQKPPEKPEAKDPEWDFERLFAEGEEEAQAARRRRLEELREKNRSRCQQREREQRKRAADEEESWAAVMAASHALELLHTSGAPLSQWRKFLGDPVFLNVRANLDFLFALEDFLEQRPGLPLEIRRALYLAYEDCNASRYPVYRRLYKLLDIPRQDQRRTARAKSGWRNAWRNYPPWRKAVLSVCFTILAVFVFVGLSASLRTAYQDYAGRQTAKRWAETAPQWLEEDYGEPFLHAVSGDIFAPAADPGLYFRASPCGERSDRWPGYQTNYPCVLVKRALEDFAEERELDLEPASYSHDIGSAPGAYLLNLPLLGAEQDVAALGALLEGLSQQDWYQVPLSGPQDGAEYQVQAPVTYTVYLCHKGLAFYEAPSQEGFDTEEALSLYAQAGPAFCRYILDQSGLADQHLGEGAYVLQDQELVELGGETFFQVSGVDKASGQPRVQYLLSGGMLFCLPRERMEEIHSITDLYRGGVQHLQLDKIGLVIVMDQVPGA
jgi:hypothetical protein